MTGGEGGNAADHPSRPEAEIAAAQRHLVADAAWASVVGAFSGGVVLVGLALLLGADPFTIGLLAAIPAIGQVAQLPAIAMVERLRRRKAIAVWLGVAGRVIILLLALLPLLPDRSLALALLVLAEIIIAGFSAMSACAWNSWMHDLLPRHAMGAFVARRLAWPTAASVASGLAAGLLVDHWPGGDTAHAYVLAMALAALAGFVSSWHLGQVPDVPMGEVRQGAPSLLGFIRRPLVDRDFRQLIRFLASWSFATNLAAPFITVYLLQQLGLSLGMVLLLWACSQLANALTVGLWGRLSDDLSDKAVLRAAAPAVLACLLALPVASTIGREGPVLPLLVVIHLVMGIAMGGTALASSSIALRLAPRGEGTAYMAAVSLCSAAAAAVAPVLGGLLADWFAARELTVAINWTAPGAAFTVTPIRLQHWDFFFVLAAVAGLYALHRLELVRDGEGGGARLHARDLALEARRTLRGLSSASGLRAGSAFPLGRIAGRSPARIRSEKAQ